MRGKRANKTAEVGVFRITPAGAGKTDSDYFNLRRVEDHPRRCGENGIRYMMNHTAMGSPPQVRGKHFFARHPQPPARITPAGAGKTYAFARGKAFRQDHPRRCGENPD